MTLDDLKEMEDRFFGEEGNYEDEGAFADDYTAAEWARSNVGHLFEELRRLLEMEARLYGD